MNQKETRLPYDTDSPTGSGPAIHDNPRAFRCLAGNG